MNSETYAIYCQPYYDTKNQEYRNIITINAMPKGPLASMVRRVKFDPVSPYKCDGQSCGYAIMNGCNNFMPMHELPTLFSFLMSNGYKIDTSLTKMLNASEVRINSGNNLIAFIS